MSTEEQKPAGSPSSDAKAEPPASPAEADAKPPANVDAAVAWPPPEAAPTGDADGNGAAKAAPAAAAGPGDSGVMTAPETPAAEKPANAGKPAGGDMPAAEPQEEMALSNSTLHWLEDGDQAVPGRLTEPGSMPSYDPHAPVPGRRRAVLVVGTAGAIALIIAGTFYAQAQKRHAAEAPAPAVIEPARDITTRAEVALAANRLDEALELAHLALSADERFADAHFVAASVEKARNHNDVARDEFRKYLELAPLGTHAAEARSGLSSLPP
jgi:hypothetical protein